MSTTVMTIDSLIEGLENMKDEEAEDLYVVIGEPVGSNLDVTFDDRIETVEIESTQGWAHGTFDEDLDAWQLSNEVSHYLFGSLLVEETYLSDDAVMVAKEGGRR